MAHIQIAILKLMEGMSAVGRNGLEERITKDPIYLDISIDIKSESGLLRAKVMSEHLRRIQVQRFGFLPSKLYHDAINRQELKPGPAIECFLFGRTHAQTSKRLTSTFILLKGLPH